jgi:hypothetical protein
MARTSITPTDIAKLINSSDTATTPVKTTIDATLVTNGVVFDAGVDSKVLVKVVQTAADTLLLTVQSQSGVAAEDFTVDMAQNAEVMFVFETENFEIMSGTDRGKVYIDFETSFTGTIEIYNLPK